MPSVTRWRCLGTLITFACMLALTGCGKNADTPKVAGDPKSIETPKAESKKNGTAPGDDGSKVIKAAGGDPDKPPSKNGDTEELLKAKPDVVLKEADFAAEQKANQGIVNKYDEKIIDLVGTLKSFDFTKRIEGWRPVFMLDSLNYKYTCRDPNALARVAPGQTVTLRARYSTLVGFTNCVIVKVEGDPPEEVSADKLAEAYTADMEGTEKKYKNKYVVMKGKARIIKDKPSLKIALSSPGVKPEITCHLGTDATELATQQGWIKEGQEVQILCRSTLGDPAFFSEAVIRGPMK